MTALPRPMLAVPTDALPDDAEQWAYEMKWDGYRAIVGIAEGRLHVASRRGLDITSDYPELAGLVDAPGVDDVVIDGELVVLDDDGRPSFAAIQRHQSSAVLMCFDLLRLEGVVAKRRDAPYGPGARSSAWRKLKLVRRQELVVGGWLPGDGRLAGTVGSLLLGVHDEPGGRLEYAGRVGSGLDDAARDALAAGLVRRATSPFVDPPRLPVAVWVEPDIVAEVKFTEWTDDGVLRQPVFVGLRSDKVPADVVRET